MLKSGKAWATLALAAGMLGGGSASALAGDGQNFARIERGRYLTIAADCAACHTDPASSQPFAGGRPIPTPFGIVIAANITPDRDTGIGSWTDAQFDAAVRGGRMPNGKRLYPAMPFPYYAHMSRTDVGAIRAYLNTVQAVHHPVVSDQLPFPFSIRASMWLWDALYFTPGEFKPDPSQSGQWNRGAYLVEGAGHCASCHTPKTLLGGDKSGQAFRGTLVQGWFGPDITDDTQRGISNWTVADIVDYLKKGHNRYAGATGPMAEEVSDSSSKMTPDDLQAIATFLKSQPGQNAGATAVSAHDPAMVAGAAIYGDLCSACHKGNGTGVPFLIPSLAASDSVASRDPTSVLRVVLGGGQSVATDEEPTAPAMPGFGRDLNDAQVAAVATYVRNTWGHAAAAVSDGEVGRVRKSLAVAQR